MDIRLATIKREKAIEESVKTSKQEEARLEAQLKALSGKVAILFTDEQNLNNTIITHNKEIIALKHEKGLIEATNTSLRSETSNLEDTLTERQTSINNIIFDMVKSKEHLIEEKKVVQDKINGANKELASVEAERGKVLEGIKKQEEDIKLRETNLMDDQIALGEKQKNFAEKEKEYEEYKTEKKQLLAKFESIRLMAEKKTDQAEDKLRVVEKRNKEVDEKEEKNKDKTLALDVREGELDKKEKRANHLLRQAELNKEK